MGKILATRPLITTLPRLGAEATVPFVGFAEAYVLSAFRRAGVLLQRIRPAIESLSRAMGVEQVLVAERLYTDGAEVLYDYATQREDGDLLELVVVRTGQHQFSELVRDYLTRITYGGDGHASRVRLPSYRSADVIVDVPVAFGLPLVVQGGARVEDLVGWFVAATASPTSPTTSRSPRAPQPSCPRDQLGLAVASASAARAPTTPACSGVSSVTFVS